jgi:hypothetical protein
MRNASLERQVTELVDDDDAERPNSKPLDQPADWQRSFLYAHGV